MDVDEITHALGVIPCRSPLGDLDLAPGTMHVEENEEIDRAIATILIIVTFEPAGLGRNGLTHLADELHRAFVEAHHWPSGVGRAHPPCGRRIRRRPAECTTCLCARA